METVSSFCFFQGLPNFLSPKQTSCLTQLPVSCILKDRSLSSRTHILAVEQAILPWRRDCQSAMSTVPSTLLDNRFLAASIDKQIISCTQQQKKKGCGFSFFLRPLFALAQVSLVSILKDLISTKKACLQSQIGTYL